MSLENQETEASAEELSFVDSVLGGESHSPETEHAERNSEAGNENAGGGEPIPEDDGEDFFAESDDSIEQDKSKPKTDVPNPAPRQPETPNREPEAATNPDLDRELETLRKRLHDTQSAFHKATEDRKALQKELDELKAKRDDEDDWFSEDDEERRKVLEADLKKSDEELARVQAESEDLAKRNAVAQWDAAAAPVIREHPDFEHVMYEVLVPMLDPQKGNPQVIAAWNALEDKSPAAQYAFAKKMLEILEFQRDPNAYRENLRKEIINENRKPENDGGDGNDGGDDDGEPDGKEALDMLPSADMPEASQESRGMSFVDALFG